MTGLGGSAEVDGPGVCDISESDVSFEFMVDLVLLSLLSCLGCERSGDRPLLLSISSHLFAFLSSVSPGFLVSLDLYGRRFGSRGLEGSSFSRVTVFALL